MTTQNNLIDKSLEAVTDTVVVTSDEQSFATYEVGILNRQRGDAADVRSKTANLIRPKQCVNISTHSICGPEERIGGSNN